MPCSNFSFTLISVSVILLVRLHHAVFMMFTLRPNQNSTQTPDSENRDVFVADSQKENTQTTVSTTRVDL